MNFRITPKTFPFIEHIAAPENLCQSFEEIGDPDSIPRDQGIRNFVSGESRKGNNIQIKWIVIEDRDTYIQKMYQQIEEGEYTKATRSEKTLQDNIHQKLVAQLKSMGLTDFKQRRPNLVTAPVMANMYLLNKVPKKNFPGRQL